MFDTVAIHAARNSRIGEGMSLGGAAAAGFARQDARNAIALSAVGSLNADGFTDRFLLDERMKFDELRSGGERRLHDRAVGAVRHNPACAGSSRFCEPLMP